MTGNRIILLAGVIISAASFVIFPWVFNISGLQLALNFLSGGLTTAGLFLWVIPLAVIGTIAGFKDVRFAWAAVFVVIGSFGWYASATQNNSLFTFGDTGFLGSGFWITIGGAALVIAGQVMRTRREIPHDNP